MKKAPKILYFIRGSLPTKEEQTEAESFGANVAFRNVEFINDAEKPEAADGVAGGSYQETEDGKPIGEPISLIPDSYAHYPKAAEVMAAFKDGKELPNKAPVEKKPSAWTANK